MYRMGKGKNRRDQVDIWESADIYHDETESVKPSSSNRERDKNRNEGKPSTDLMNGGDDESSDGQESSDEQTDLGLDPYVTFIEDLKMKLDASQRATEAALVFYTNHQVEIRKVDTTRQQLIEATKLCEDYRIAITTLQRLDGDKEQTVAKKMAAIEEDRRELDVLKEDAAKHKQRLAEEKIAFEEMTRKKEAEQLLKLKEEKAKLETVYKNQFAKRVEELGKATQKSQDDQRKKISDLQSKNDELAQSLEELKRKLKDKEKSCRDIEKLRSLSENEVDELTRKLKMAENEFGLYSNSTEYFHVPNY